MLRDLQSYAAMPCEAIIPIEQEGPEETNFAIAPEHGAICPLCKDPTCADCLVATQQGLLCPDCSHGHMTDLQAFNAFRKQRQRVLATAIA
jgi:hypothetical protein